MLFLLHATSCEATDGLYALGVKLESFSRFCKLDFRGFCCLLRDLVARFDDRELGVMRLLWAVTAVTAATFVGTVCDCSVNWPVT